MKIRLLLAVFVLVGAMHATEVIRQFSAQVIVQPDARLVITEKITVTAEGHKIRRGIYRDFPTRYTTPSGQSVEVGFRVIRVLRDDRDEPWHTENLANGIRVYIGSGARMLPAGVHDYELTYTTDHQLGFFTDHDEIYWNVTGTGWDFPIESTSAEVILPTGTQPLATTGYTGPQGARGKDFTTDIPAQPGNVARFSTTRTLAAHEGLTVVVTFPKGTVKPEPARNPSAHPTLSRQATRTASTRPSKPWDDPHLRWAVLGLFATLGYFLLAWWQVGRDPPSRTIIPLYAPPAGLSPAAVRHLVRMGSDGRCFAANLVSLAVRGALKIERLPSFYRLVRQNSSVPMSDDESIMFRRLFIGTVSTRDLDSDAYASVTNAREGMDRELKKLMQSRLYSRNTGWWLLGLLLSLIPVGVVIASWAGQAILPGSLPGILCLLFLRSAWRSFREKPSARTFLVVAVLAVMPIANGVALPWIFDSLNATAWGLIAVAMGAILLDVVFFDLLKAPSAEGRALLDQIAGFKLYLGVAEKDRLNLENPPERTPELFDHFLPYALALGVEQRWCEQFAGILDRIVPPDGNSQGYRDPAWYSSGGLLLTDLNHLGQSLGRSFDQAIAAASKVPGSTSGMDSVSYSSGSDSSGGSSGGGGGGGGGGGW